MAYRLTEEEEKEFTGYLKAARDKHISYKAELILPGFLPFAIDVDVNLLIWKRTLHKGVYHRIQPNMVDGEPEITVRNQWVFFIQLDEESALAELQRLEEEGNTVEEVDDDGNRFIKATAPASFNVGMVRADNGKGEPILFSEILVWLAVQDASEAGDVELANRIVRLAYHRKDEAGKKEYHRKDAGNVVANALSMAIDPITNAVMARNKGCIEASSYFTESGVKVDTGNGGFALVDIRASADTDIDAAYKTYRLNDRDRFWLDPLYTLAIEHGKTEIHGSEILKLAGYANPYTASDTMANACASIQKAISTRIAIDVTSEKRNKRRGHYTLTSSIRLQPVVNGIIDLDEYTSDDGNDVIRDFTVYLQTKEPAQSLPLAQYAHSRGMLTTVEKDDYTFKSIKRLHADDRQMWAYVLRVVKAKGLSGTIRFKTLWRNLDLEESETSEFENVDRQGKPLGDGKPVTAKTAERRQRESMRKRRERLKNNLEKMLDEKAGVLFKSWSWHKDASGIVDGVKIVRTTARKR